MLLWDEKSVFLHYLQKLKHLIAIVEKHDSEKKDLLNARLVPDMFPLSTQLRITANFALRACCHVRGLEAASFDEFPPTYQGLKAQIECSIDHLRQIPDSIPYVDVVDSDKGGFSALSLPAAEYLSQFAMPNFFFHMSMVYAIARQAGVPLSKGDFDGYHQYPEGFSFEKND